jgi:hypothetical protein
VYRIESDADDQRQLWLVVGRLGGQGGAEQIRTGQILSYIDISANLLNYFLGNNF